ncbi:hypothetical protein CP09DC78_1178, partial [Chlamydia psittaci 09DC78]
SKCYSFTLKKTFANIVLCNFQSDILSPNRAMVKKAIS